jgi:small subunit ribosomal protein S8
MTNDLIADMLTRIRNAMLAKHKMVNIEATRMTISMAKVMCDEGFIDNMEKISINNRPYLVLTLKYEGNGKHSFITCLKRISKPGRRVYVNARNLPRILGGLGIAILSTSSGVMSDRQARLQGLGGEVLCYLW